MSFVRADRQCFNFCRDLDLKGIIYEAYEQGRMIAVLPFVNKVHFGHPANGFEHDCRLLLLQVLLIWRECICNVYTPVLESAGTRTSQFGCLRFQLKLIILQVLEPCKDSKVFKPPNPWVQSILALVAEIYAQDKLKLNLKFEIELLFRNMGIQARSSHPKSCFQHCKLPCCEPYNHHCKCKTVKAASSICKWQYLLMVTSMQKVGKRLTLT